MSKINKIKITNVLYTNIDEAIGRDIEDAAILDSFIISNDKLGDDIIMTFGKVYRVIDKDLIFVEGTYFVPSDDGEDMEPDWSLTLIYANVPDNMFDVNNYLYFEQDSPATSIHNYQAGLPYMAIPTDLAS